MNNLPFETPTELLERLETSLEQGLKPQEASRRLERFGRNLLPTRKPPTLLRILADQFISPLILVLLLAAVVSALIGDLKDATFIAAVLLLNAVIGGYQEWKAEKNTRSLQGLLKVRASVLRDGTVAEVDASTLVPGDVVWLESGNRVPADLRLVTTKGLEIDESFLTGESLPILKSATFVPEENSALGDRLEMAFAGATVNRGRGRGIVVATGTNTVVGHLAGELSATLGGTPPLVVRMERFSKAVALIVAIAAISVGGLGVVLQGYTVTEMFFLAVAMAVSAIPEGLPVAMTVALAVATRRMAKRGVIVRQLSAVEGLGSCTMIASDKTGTLTCNELTVRELRLPDGRKLEVTGRGFELEGVVLEKGRPAEIVGTLECLIRTAVLCNEARMKRRGKAVTLHGDATDIALMALGVKAGFEREGELKDRPLCGEVPFEPELRYAATFHQEGEHTVAYVKGAPEKIADFCSTPPDPGVVQEMASIGLRTIALAYGRVDGEHLENLEFLGYVGMIDPLRRGVKESVQACQSAGMSVIMITGDHPVTALAIGRELGLANSMEEVITGPELAKIPSEELPSIFERVSLFSRIEPQQKHALVVAAREAGHLVAVTGDGVNDASALRASNIGVAMGRSGTDVARDAADLVIADDDFSTIVAGVEEGRIAYSNVRKVIYLLVSTGAAELLLLGLSVATGLPIPLLPVQLLWLNLVTNGIQDVALAFEPGEGEPLEQKPRPPKERVFNRLMLERTLLAGAVVGLSSFLVFRYLLGQGMEVPQARNYVFFLLVLFEIVHIGNCRSESVSAFRLSPFRNPILLLGSAAALAIHLVAMNTVFGQSVLGTAPIPLHDGLKLFGVSLTVLLAIELHKLWIKKSKAA